MDSLKEKLISIFTKLFNTRAAGMYILLFAIAIGVGTFIENDYGTSSAQKLIYKAKWFELLLLMFSIAILYNIYKFRMIPQKKWALLLFHLSMVIILIGAAITRYYGYEGVMHIREGASSNMIQSADTYLLFDIDKNGEHYRVESPVLFATLGNNHWKESFKIGDDIIACEVTDFIPNPKQSIKATDDGQPIIKIVIGGMGGREEYFLKEGKQQRKPLSLH